MDRIAVVCYDRKCNTRSYVTLTDNGWHTHTYTCPVVIRLEEMGIYLRHPFSASIQTRLLTYMWTVLDYKPLPCHLVISAVIVAHFGLIKPL